MCTCVTYWDSSQGLLSLQEELDAVCHERFAVRVIQAAQSCAQLVLGPCDGLLSSSVLCGKLYLVHLQRRLLCHECCLRIVNHSIGVESHINTTASACRMLGRVHLLQESLVGVASVST